jgi:hypothetical protein
MSHLPLAGSCTVAVSLSAVFRYPCLAFAAWAGDESSLGRPPALMGFNALRRFAPTDGWMPHLCGPGPTCLFASRRPTR